MPYTNDIYGMLLQIADLSGAADTYSHDKYGQILRIADTVGAPAGPAYSNDILGQLKRINVGLGIAAGSYTNDVYGQILRLADGLYGAGGGGYSADVYGQLNRIAVSGGVGAIGTPVPDFTNYKSGNWTLYLNPYNAAGLVLTGSDSAVVQPATFPNGTVMNWTWPTRSPGIPIGFNQLCFGDYFNTSAQTPITARQISAITALSLDLNMSHSASPANSHVCIIDYFLTDAANAHGVGNHKVEIEIALSAPAYFQSYVASIGSGITGAQLGQVTLNGITWTVARDDTANSGAYPDIIFMPTDLQDRVVTSIDLKPIHAWLLAQGRINAAWYFNGLAVGVEPTSGAGSMSFPSIAATYSGTSTSNVIVANGTFTNSAQSSNLTGTLPITYISEHYADPQGDISNFTITYLGWLSFSTGGTELNQGSDATIKCFVEYPSGTFTQVLMSGAATGIIPNGGQLITDAAGLTIKAGDKYWIRTVVTAVNSGGTIALHDCFVAPSTVGVINGSISGDFGNSGVIPAQTTTAALFAPSAIIGTIAHPSPKQAVVLGDSINAAGTGDITSVGIKGGTGPIPRMLDPICSYVRIGRGGLAAADLLLSNTKTRAFITSLGTSYSHLFNALGTNDVGSRVAHTAAQAFADWTTVNGWFNAPNIYGMALGAMSTSTDSWKTTGNQTALSPNAAQVPTFNASIVATGKYVDFATATMTAANSMLWKNPYVRTVDGIHPNSFCAADAANSMRLAFGGLFIPEAETLSFFNATLAAGLAAPPQPWLAAYNRLIFMAKQRGWYAQSSCFFLHASYDQNVALRNIKRNGDHFSIVGTVSWAKGSGFDCLGTGALVSTYNPTTAADGLWTLNSMHIALDNARNVSDNTSADCSIGDGTLANFRTRGSTNFPFGRFNSGTASGATSTTDSSGDWIATRTASNLVGFVRNFSAQVGSSIASTTLANGTLELGGIQTTYRNQKYSYLSVGAGLASSPGSNLTYDMFCFKTEAAAL